MGKGWGTGKPGFLDEIPSPFSSLPPGSRPWFLSWILYQIFLSTQCTRSEKFSTPQFLPKGKPITKFRLLFNLLCPWFSTRHCGYFLKQESSKVFFSLLEGCKMPFNIFGWRKACLADETLHENTCELSWVPLSPILQRSVSTIKANTLFLLILKNNVISYSGKKSSDYGMHHQKTLHMKPCLDVKI